MGKALGAAWVYVLGVFIVLIGLYVFFTMRHISFSHFTSSFWIMLIGLLVSGIGATRGRKILRSVPSQKTLPVATAQPGPAQSAQQKPPQTPQKPVETVQQKPIETAPQKTAQQAPAQLAKAMPAVTTPSQAQARAEPAQTITPAEKLAAPANTEGIKKDVVRLIICPSCGSENSENDNYCYNCGKKLRPKRKK